MNRTRNFDHALALVAAVVVALVAFKLCDRLGLCVEPARSSIAEAGISSR